MKYEMVVRVEIRQREGSYAGGLNVNETFPFEIENFAALCKVLTKFHELAETLKGQKVKA